MSIYNSSTGKIFSKDDWSVIAFPLNINDNLGDSDSVSFTFELRIRSLELGI